MLTQNENQAANANVKSDDESQICFNAFINGDELAFSRLYDLHTRQLLNYGSRLCSDDELLKDCVHDVFIKIYTKREELRNVSNIKSYLFISLKNRICDEQRKRVYLSALTPEDVSPVATENIETDYIALEKEQINSMLLKRLMSLLSDRQYQALSMYYIEERKYEDICQVMDMNYQSVRNLMHRGMLKLRSMATA